MQNSKFSIEENGFENAFSKMAAIVSGHQCINKPKIYASYTITNDIQYYSGHMSGRLKNRNNT